MSLLKGKEINQILDEVRKISPISDHVKDLEKRIGAMEIYFKKIEPYFKTIVKEIEAEQKEKENQRKERERLDRIMREHELRDRGLLR